MENDIDIEPGSVRLDGCYDLVFQPGSVMAHSGTLLAGTLPMRPGSGWNWLGRAFEADRFTLRHGHLQGTLWLGTQTRSQVMPLPMADGETVTVLSSLLLCAELSCRVRGDRLRLLPGSWQKPLALTELRCEPETFAPIVCTASPLNEARLEDGETLHVSPSAVVGWSGCAKPTAFCPRLRLRDLFLPRLPETLTLDFKGPGRVFFQGVASSERNRKAKPLTA